jgi:hypothetical protein
MTMNKILVDLSLELVQHTPSSPPPSNSDRAQQQYVHAKITATTAAAAASVVIQRRPKKALPPQPRITSVRWRPSQFSFARNAAPMFV